MTTDNWLAISAGATFLLALAAFWAILQNYKFRKEDRRIQALYRTRSWAEKSIQLLTIAVPLQEKEAMEALKTNIQIIRAESLSALADAEVLGGEVKHKVQRAVHNFNNFTGKAESANQSTDFEVLLRGIIGDFCDVINSASEL